MTNEPIILCKVILRAWFVRHRHYLESTKTFGFVFVFVLAHEQATSTEKLTLEVKEVDFHRIGKDVSNKKTTVVLSSRSSCHLVIFVSVPVEPGLLWVESPLRRAEDRPRRCLGHVVGRRKRLACKGKQVK